MVSTVTVPVQVMTNPIDTSWQTDPASGLRWRMAPNRTIWLDTVAQAIQINWTAASVIAGPPIVLQSPGGAFANEQSYNVNVYYSGDPPPAPRPPIPPTPPITGCIRRAWLTLNDLSLPLEDTDAGYYCTNLDLGSPAVREVVNNRPDRDGIDDRTRLMGSRAVAADITATENIDAVATSFGPFMVPSVRPVLHYVLDRPGAPERTLTLRAASYGWPIKGSSFREIQLQWIAADPTAYDATVQTGIAWAGSLTSAGRTYNLTFDRVYPAGAMPPTNALLYSPGDISFQPVIKIYGPLTTPRLTFRWMTGGVFKQQLVVFKAGTTINAGDWITIDPANRRIVRNDDLTQSWITQVDWAQSQWPFLPPDLNITMSLQGGGANSSSQAVATWQDGYFG